ncbi:MAG: RluA family pseudouridine synthase [Spirochaetales bacterium]|nr:MAG: RluA family pseudouridine synthase [Spirochaetales bacterium]
MSITVRKFTAGPDDNGRRVDRIVRRLYPDTPLSALYRLFRTGSIRLGNMKAKPEDRVSAGDILAIRSSDASGNPDSAAGSLDRKDAPGGDRSSLFAAILIVQTSDLAIVNKPRGLLTHGAGGLDELASAYFSARASGSLAFRPAPLHRLDRNTSGALAISASIAGARAFSLALREGRVDKIYLAVLDGRFDGNEEWVDTLSRTGSDGKTEAGREGARPATTLVEPLAYAAGRTLARIRLMTGFTHQIRAQAAIHGHPLSGDAKYGGSAFAGGYLLHCAELGIPEDIGIENPGIVVAELSPRAEITIKSIFLDIPASFLPRRSPNTLAAGPEP